MIKLLNCQIVKLVNENAYGNTIQLNKKTAEGHVYPSAVYVDCFQFFVSYFPFSSRLILRSFYAQIYVRLLHLPLIADNRRQRIRRVSSKYPGDCYPK